MQIPVACSCGCNEWFMIELQGEIEGTGAADVMENLCVGMLCAAKEDNVAHLSIGYHQLEGKVSKLPKPIAVLKKRQAAGEPSTSGNAAEGAAGAPAQVEFDLIGVVRRKLHFKSRPKALISKCDPTAVGSKAVGKRAAVDAGFFTKRSRPTAAAAQ